MIYIFLILVIICLFFTVIFTRMLMDARGNGLIVILATLMTMAASIFLGMVVEKIIKLFYGV